MKSLLEPQFRTLLTMGELAAYLHKSSGEAARKWAKRCNLPMSKVGREWRVDKRDVDRLIEHDTTRAVQNRGRS